MGISSSIVGKLYLNHDMHNLYLNEVKTHTNLAILYFITKRKLYINDSLSNIDFHINSDSQKIAKYNKNERVNLKFTITIDQSEIRNNKKEVKEYSFHGKDPNTIYESNNWIQVNRKSNTLDCVIYVMKYRT